LGSSETEVCGFQELDQEEKGGQGGIGAYGVIFNVSRSVAAKDIFEVLRLWSSNIRAAVMFSNS